MYVFLPGLIPQKISDGIQQNSKIKAGCGKT